MSWQEDEIKKRREQQASEAEKRERENIRLREIRELWGRLLTVNETLPREIKMHVEVDDDIVIMKGNKSDLWLNFRCGKMYYRVLSHCDGIQSMSNSYRINYDLDKAVFFLASVYSDSGYQFLAITNESVPMIIQNLCINRHITEGLCHGGYEIFEPPKKRNKILGIF